MTEQLMVGRGGPHRTHYVERTGHHPFRGFRPACRNASAEFEADVGGEVTCGTCRKLPGIPRRARLLIPHHGIVPTMQCWSCQRWLPSATLRAVGEARYCKEDCK